MHLNDRPCWLQVNRCGRTNGLPAPRPPVLEATRWETHTQAEMRSSDVEKIPELGRLSVFSHLWFCYCILKIPASEATRGQQRKGHRMNMLKKDPRLGFVY